MPVLIILEGVDGAGKTTLAERLRDSMVDAEVLHRGPPQSDDMREEYLGALVNYLPGSGRDVICDRWHVGELVYGPAYRGKSLLAEDHRTLTYIERSLHRLGALLIYCRPPLETIEERLHERGDDYIKKGDHIQLFAAYEAMMPRPVVTVTIDTADVTDWRLEQLRGCARFLESCAAEAMR